MRRVLMARLNMSIDADPHLQEAASPRTVVVPVIFTLSRMKTHRSAFLGALAFYPAVALVIIAISPETFFAIPVDAAELWSFLAKWWFGLVVATVIAVTIFFSVHAWRRTAVRWWRRALWLVGFWFLGPIVLPAYWWADSHAT